MRNVVDAGAASDLPPGAATFVAVDGREIGIWNDRGRLFAMDNICPHQGAQLHEGWVRDGCVTCPWHAWSYRLATGRMELGDSFDALPVFAVEVRDGRIVVDTEPASTEGPSNDG